MWEKLNIATRILMLGSFLWVGTVIFKRDDALKQAISKIESAQKDILDARNDMRVARDSLKSVQIQLENLQKLAQETKNALAQLKVERTNLSNEFYRFVASSEKFLETQKKTLFELKKNRDALIEKINQMQMEH